MDPIPPDPQLLARYTQALEAALAAAEQERSIGARYALLMQELLQAAGPHREQLRSLAAAAPSPAPDDPAAAVFLRLVQGAEDAPKAPRASELATLLHAGHLLLVFFWLRDRTEGQRATQELLALCRDMLALLGPALILPPVARGLTRLAGILSTMLDGSTPTR